VAGQLEIARQHARELLAERAVVVAAEILQRRDRDRERLAAGTEDLPGDDRSCGRGGEDDGERGGKRGGDCGDASGRDHPEARPPSSEWNSMTKSWNSFA